MIFLKLNKLLQKITKYPKFSLINVDIDMKKTRKDQINLRLL